MSFGFVRPAYGTATLAEVMPALAHHLAPDLAGADDVLNIPQASRYVLVLVDGLGHELLYNNRDRVPYLGGLLANAIPLTCSLPSTTATSLTTLGTGLGPGHHGVVGYRFRYNEKILNPLVWDLEEADPQTVQPNTTWFERLADAGVAVSSVSPAHFAHSGLTLAAQRGAEFAGFNDEAGRGERIDLTVAASQTGERSLVYLYERDLDHAGHGFGCVSVEWRLTLDQIDEFLETLRAQLDPDVCLLITGDHGMVDVPEAHQIVIEDVPGLTSGVDMIAGEGRMRQIYTVDPDSVAKRWASKLGERALVITKHEAMADGWFGPIQSSVSSRIGDVLVAMREDWALMSLAAQGEWSLVGQHGSLTGAEMRVPLLIDEG